ncbi:MAG: tetratricopeptide repeat protein [Myxococcales bacterium]|nr:tetratricopeptide repeat protein [Myxococcales bacterium]
MSQVARRYYARGVQAIASNELTVAVEQLQAAVDLAPTFGDARIAFAVALAKFGDAPRAANVLRAGLGRAPSPVSTAALWATLGDVLTLSGDFLGAEDALRQAGDHPDFAVRAASGLARVYAKLGRFPDAVVQLRRAAAGSSN